MVAAEMVFDSFCAGGTGQNTNLTPIPPGLWLCDC